MNSDNEYDSNMTGCSMPSNPKMNMEEHLEEVTRKIAPAMIMPSMGPMPTIPVNTMPWTSSSNEVQMKSNPLVFEKKQQQQQQQRRSQPKTFSWKLRAVPVLPEFHSLERAAVFVPNAQPSDVSSRISDTLRERSIEAHYETGKAKVKCRTAEGVDFCIRLYRGRGRYSHGIIVEVQRRFGSSLVFHHDTQAIFDGARDIAPTPLPPVCLRLPEVSESDDDGEEYQFNPVSSAESSLKMVAKMMKLPGFDSQYLGLQTLSPLADSRRLSMSTARTVAASLFRPGSEVGGQVLDYVLEKNKKTPSITQRGVFEDDDLDDEEDESFRLLRNISLNILSNALKAHGKIPIHLRESLRPILVRDIKDAEEHPNTALLSAKCLEHFVPGDEDTEELYRAFRVAYQIGEARHKNLMRQAQKCLDRTVTSMQR